MVLVAIGFMIFKFRRAILNQFTLWKTHWTEGEPAYFKRIEASQTPAEMLNAIHQWLQKLPAHPKGQTLTHFAHEQQRQDLSDPFENLQRAIISPDTPWDKTQLVHRLKQTRQDILQKNKRLTKSTTNAALSPLNPNDGGGF